MTDQAKAPPRLEFSAVWSLTGLMLRKLAWPLTAMGLALFVVPNLLFQLAMNPVLGLLIGSSYEDMDRAVLIARAIGVARMAFPLFTLYLLQAAAARYVFAQREARKPSIGDSLLFALRRSGAALGLALFVFICTLAGTMFLIVPGLLIWTAWALAGPVVFLEGLGLNAALERSARMTRGNRSLVFAAHLMVAVAMVIVLGFVPPWVIMWLAPALNVAPVAIVVPMSVVLLVAQTVLALVFTAVTVSIYILLKGLRQDSQATAEVFD